VGLGVVAAGGRGKPRAMAGAGAGRERRGHGQQPPCGGVVVIAGPHDGHVANERSGDARAEGGR
jgi:hypothetical protein